jgi:hypothetical protein
MFEQVADHLDSTMAADAAVTEAAIVPAADGKAEFGDTICIGHSFSERTRWKLLRRPMRLGAIISDVFRTKSLFVVCEKSLLNNM